jgi:crossover junction endodeoxyribonuclease RuvC
MLTIVGVDPGLNGAFAVWQDGDIIRLDDIPRFEKSLNAYAFQAELARWRIDLAMIEEVGPMPKQGVSSTFTFGRAYGTIEGVFGALQVPVQHVRPRVWQKHFSLTARTSALEKAVRLFPEWEPGLRRKKDHNRADAILIADYAVHVYKELREAV